MFQMVKIFHWIVIKLLYVKLALFPPHKTHIIARSYLVLKKLSGMKLEELHFSIEVLYYAFDVLTWYIQNLDCFLMLLTWIYDPQARIQDFPIGGLGVWKSRRPLFQLNITILTRSNKKHRTGTQEAGTILQRGQAQVTSLVRYQHSLFISFIWA